VGYMGSVRRRRCGGESGATLVEFAIIAPLLLVLLIGTLEAGWAFSNNLDVNHATREGARFAVVNGGITGMAASAVTQEIVDYTCDRLKAQLRPFAEVSVTATANPIGSPTTVIVRADHQSLSSLLPMFGSINLESQSELRMEQVRNWSNTAGAVPCP
jgi:Flp pilus assembly protein TadG